MTTNDIKKLDRILAHQDFAGDATPADLASRYAAIARGYASLENVIAVLSDMRSYASRIFYGRFADTLGISHECRCGEVNSIWEENILGRIHPDDLAGKYLYELRFFSFIKSVPPSFRGNYCLMAKLRMKDASANYIPTLHRMFYVHAPGVSAVRFAVCLYGPLTTELPGQCTVVNTADGHTVTLDSPADGGLLSDREKQVLRLIARGMTSKSIAETLSISVNTVSRHRQNILGKLRVKTSIEACHTAEELHFI